ncbi:Wzz/FepE/Etk N-terminal domain-containing protein [Gammaproteobacteria bacterium]|nr:Wzz/FepE/Etk N-terminal domain-containing protein [Gammaproteobacteria bacterium]
MTNPSKLSFDSENQYEVNLYEIALLLWSRKTLIGAIIVFSGILSIVIALSLPNLYKSSGILAPVQSDNAGQGGLLSQVGDIANSVGLGMASGGDDKSTEAIERMISFEFFDQFVLPNIKLQDLMAVDQWDPMENTLSYDPDLYNVNTGTWVRKPSFPYQSKPSRQEAFIEFRDIFSVSQDTLTFFITVSLKHPSPFIAQEWLQIIISEINGSMRNAEKIKAAKSYNYLTKQLQQAQYEQVRQTIAVLMEEEMKTLMLIESNEDYIFTIIDSPIAPELKSEPMRSILVIFGTFLGSIVAMLYVILGHYIRRNLHNIDNNNIK